MSLEIEQLIGHNTDFRKQLIRQALCTEVNYSNLETVEAGRGWSITSRTRAARPRCHQGANAITL